MPVKINFRFNPLHELIVSLRVFANPRLHKKCDGGGEWVKQLKKMLPSSLVEQTEEEESAKTLRVLNEYLVLSMPEHESIHKVSSFNQWVNSINARELLDNENLPPALLEKLPALFQNIDKTCRLLEQWEEAYFKHIDPLILKNLEQDAREKQKLLDQQTPFDLIEQVTGGIRLEEIDKLQRVIMVPQYHGRPLNLYRFSGDTFSSHYPCEALPPAEGEPSPGLLRQVGAVSDPNRLKALRFLAQGEKNFTEIVGHLGMAKSTVHYHLIALRAAGLVRVHLNNNDHARYSLRKKALPEISSELEEYITGSVYMSQNYQQR